MPVTPLHNEKELFHQIAAGNENDHSWANAGVAPCYPGGYPCFTIKDRQGGIVWLYVDESINVKHLKTSEKDKPVIKNFTSVFAVASGIAGTMINRNIVIFPGEYKLYISVGDKDGTPRIELPYDYSDGAKRYEVGEITLSGRSE